MINDGHFKKLLEHANFEEKLAAALPNNDFEKLNIDQTQRPLIYQRLPRQNLSLKPGFDHFETILSKALLKTVCSLYPYKFEKLKTKVCLFTYVMEGLGDLAIQKRLFHLFKKKFPNIELSLITLIRTKYHDYVRKLSPSHEIIFYENTPSPNLSQKALVLLEQATVICMVPTYFEPLDKEPYKNKLLGIGEYGFYHSKIFHPASPFTSFGVHFLELGLLLEKLPLFTHKDLLDFRDKTTLTYLLKTNSCFTEALELYQKDHNLYFAYLQSKKMHEIYLKLILNIEEESQKNIDLVTTDLSEFIQALQRLLDQKKLNSIQTIEIFFDGKRSRKKLRNSGKHLRLIHLGRLSEKDFLLFLSLSKEPIGIRGNLSLTDAIYLRKAFIYDCPLHCRSFLYSLIDFIELNPEISNTLLPYFHAFDPKAVENGSLEILKNAFKDPLFFMELQMLYDSLINTYDGRNNICNVVAHKIFSVTNNSFRSNEKALLNQFKNRKLTLEELIEQLKISAKNLQIF